MDFGFQPYPLYSNKIHCLKAITVSLMQLTRALHSTVYTDVKQTLIAQESQGWLPSLHYMALLVVRGSSDVLVALVVLSSILIGTSNASSTSGSSTRSASTTSSTNSTSSTYCRCYYFRMVMEVEHGPFGDPTHLLMSLGLLESRRKLSNLSTFHTNSTRSRAWQSLKRRRQASVAKERAMLRWREILLPVLPLVCNKNHWLQWFYQSFSEQVP